MFQVGPITLVSSTSTSVSLQCYPATGSIGLINYNWYQSTTNGFVPGAGNLVVTNGPLTYTASGLTPNNTYYFRVVATDTFSNVATSAQFSAQPIGVYYTGLVDLLGNVATYLQTNCVQLFSGLLASNQITVDFDPENVLRPYVVITQSHYVNQYKVLGNQARVDNQILSFFVFADTRSLCVQLLDLLEGVLTQNTNLGFCSVVDKVAQLDPNRIDAYKGTLNLNYLQTQYC